MPSILSLSFAALAMKRKFDPWTSCTRCQHGFRTTYCLRPATRFWGEWKWYDSPGAKEGAWWVVCALLRRGLAVLKVQYTVRGDVLRHSLVRTCWSFNQALACVRMCVRFGTAIDGAFNRNYIGTLTCNPR